MYQLPNIEFLLNKNKIIDYWLSLQAKIGSTQSRNGSVNE